MIDASNVTFDGFNEADILFALGAGNDTVTGSTLGDVIAGGAGFDDLSGGLVTTQSQVELTTIPQR